MRSFLLFISFLLIFGETVLAQVVIDSSVDQKADSLLQEKDSVRIHVPGNDTLSLKSAADTNLKTNPGISLQQFYQEVLKKNPFLGFENKPYNSVQQNRIKTNGKESLFYLLVGLLLFLAFLRRTFPKYFSDLFRLFFRTSMKQRQIKDQLMQTPLPSLLMNGFFVVSSGLYVSFLLHYFGLRTDDSFWLFFLYCCLGVAAIYFIKFIGLKLSGWLFNMEEAANSYIFIVFAVNKIIGVFLLPFLILLAFMQGTAYTTAMMLSWCGIVILVLYRFVLTYTAVRNQVKVNPFHFFLYLCAFEIAPLLLIYKGLLLYFHITT